jgi:hypothetical protein
VVPPPLGASIQAIVSPVKNEGIPEAEGGLVDGFMHAWLLLFQAFIDIGQMEKIERNCADILLNREYVRQWLERPAPDVEYGN